MSVVICERHGARRRCCVIFLNSYQSLVLCHAFKDGLCATGSASVPHFQETLAEPVAHISTRLTEHYGEVCERIDIIARRSIAEELLSRELTLPSTKATLVLPR